MYENDEEVEEYDLIEEPQTTKITRDYIVGGIDCCPYCDSENIGKDFRKDIYVCFNCGRTWKVVG